MDIFVPDGYLTLERALEHFGQLKHPDEWEAEKASSKQEFRQLLFAETLSAKLFTGGKFLSLESSIWGGIEAEYIFASGWATIHGGNEYHPATVRGLVLIERSSIDALFDGDSDDPSQSPEAISDGATTGPTKQPNRGRPPEWPRQVWLECLSGLFLRGEVSATDSQESIAEALATEVEKATGKKPSINTVKKDWLRPILKGARKGDNSSD